jgi:hypothetical protein
MRLQFAFLFTMLIPFTTLAGEPTVMSWPSDADGDVFRSLEAQRFDFTRTYTIDFNVDFEQWPPAPAALDLLRKSHESVRVVPPDGRGKGYVLVQLQHQLNYQFVVDTQKQLSSLMRSFGGKCDSWGVLGP